MSWEATAARTWSCQVPRLRSAVCQTSRFQLFGDQAVVGPLIERYPKLKAASQLEHTDVAVRMDDKPSQALRAGRWRSSMWRSIEAVKSGGSDFAVSAGNTGALMAMAQFCLHGAGEIHRPAIAGTLADAAWRERGSRLRGDDRGRRRDALRVRRDGRCHGARASAAWSGRPSASSISVSRRSRALSEIRNGRPDAARGRPAASQVRRLRRR